MDYILLGLMIALIALILMKQNKGSSESITKEEIKELKEVLEGTVLNEVESALSKNNEKMLECITNFERKVNNELFKFNEVVQNKLDSNITRLSDKVDNGTTQTNNTFNSVNEKLVGVANAQENIQLLTKNILSLQDILNNTKQRGVLGEIQLYQVLNSVYDGNTKLYDKQYKLSNGTIVDAILFAPKPLGNICIDSKFPLENYKKSVDDSLSEEERKLAKKELIANVKKHIDAIATKYIIQGETADQAILFLPTETLFSEIHTNYYETILEYAYSKRIWIASPTTLIALLGLLQGVTKDIVLKENVDVILDELKGLSEEFERFDIRWKDLVKNISKVTDAATKLEITTNKITKKFDSVANI